MRIEHPAPPFGNFANAVVNLPTTVAASQFESNSRKMSHDRTAPQLRPAQRDAAFAPDFFIIGAMKAGTTTLCRYLAQFDEISVSRTKETDYFILEKNHALGDAWYRRQFDLSRPLVGEASPNYAKYDIFPGVPQRIAGVAPDAKFLFIVRDPVARLVSHYHHSWAHGHMRVGPAELLASKNGRHMVECSRYAAQIDQYLTVFDKTKFLFLDFDELCEAPQKVGDQIAGFLEIDRKVLQPELPANTAGQISHVPGVLKRAARSKILRRLDRFIPKATNELVRAAYSHRKPDATPALGPTLLDEVADLLRDDAQRFREIADKEFRQWRV